MSRSEWLRFDYIHTTIEKSLLAAVLLEMWSSVVGNFREWTCNEQKDVF